jgi:hypothetical protein
MSEEQFTPAQPDRMPTPDEERAAEQAAADVDLDEVGEHYEEMAKKGAEVRGEGEIEPERT